jgi:hypothetical protein
LGVFPSYYEPWGYTPAECTVMGIPSVSTNLSGFGCFMEEHVNDPQTYGIYVVDRRLQSANDSCQQLAQYMFDFSQLTRRQRIILRNRTERLSELLDWNILGIYYYRARQMALTRIHPEFEEEMMKLASETSSNPSTPAISRSSTPAPPEHDDEGSDDEGSEDGDEQHHKQSIVLPSPFEKPLPKKFSSTDDSYKPSFPRPASASHLPFDKQFRANAVAAANAAAAAEEPTLPDANDDEVRQITIGKENQTNLSSTNQGIKVPDEIQFSFHDHDAFVGPHILQTTINAGNTTASEKPSSSQDASNSENQTNTK